MLLLMMVVGSGGGISIVGLLHGLLFLWYTTLVLIHRAELGWTSIFAVRVIVAGPLGASLVLDRLRREHRGDENDRPSPSHEDDILLTMKNLFFIVRKAPLWVFVLFVIVLLVIVVACVLPAPIGHTFDHTNDHMLGVGPTLTLIAMALMAIASTASMDFPQRPTTREVSHRLSRQIRFPFLAHSCTHGNRPLRR